MFIIRILGKFKKVLSKRRWRMLPALVVMMLIGGMMETLSVSLILPFMNIIMKPEDSLNKWYVRMLLSIFKTQDMRIITAYISMALAAAYILKNIYIVKEVHIQQKYISGAMFETQGRLLERTLNRPYEYFMNAKSAIASYVYTFSAKL